MATLETHAREDGPEAGSGLAHELASQAKEKTGEAAEQATQKVRGQIDSRSTQLGEQVTVFGQALRKAAEQFEDEGSSGSAKAAHQVANQVDRLSIYLKNSDSDRFLGDVESFARSRPWAAGGVGAIGGFIAARFFKASSDNRQGSSRRSAIDADMPLRADTTGGIR